MDSFQIHGRVIADYRGYIESFINIRDDEVLVVVQKALSEGRLWPDADLPENDRVRYTIHSDARKEILKRLLKLNHKLYAEEEAKGLHKAPPRGGKVQRTNERPTQPAVTL
ncbi:MAG TPA: hypothetical protein VN673_17690 [Clostridia bacterium]|nr:hypothetical protein [Clostridia bacterium]